MVKSINPVSVEYLREHFSYAPDTGILSRIKSVRSDMLGIQKNYVDEFAFRLNDGNVKRHTMERLESFVSGTKGKRLTYKALIQ